MSSSQVGKTEIINNATGYYIDQDPAPILLMQPTLEMAEDWSKDRLAPMIRDTPCLRGKVRDPKSRNSGNTIRHKVFPGGHISMVGGNSPSSLAARPIRIMLADEIDRYPVSAGKEGDPVRLGEKRTTTFWNRKKVKASTPTVKGASRIEAEYERSDQRRFHVPCPDCGHEQILKWSNVHWDRDEGGNHLPETAAYVCESCGSAWTDAMRWKAVNKGRWIASKPFRGIAGFHLNELYSPWVELITTVSTFLDARKFPEQLKTFVNTSLGETWEDEGSSLEPEGLLARREPYDHTNIPAEILLITAGVDVQDDRLEVEFAGWGAEEESWGISYHIIRGDPNARDVWDELDQLLLTPFQTEDGRKLRAEAACIDSGGHHTERVYRFCARRKRRRVFAVRGQAGEKKPIWPARGTRAKKVRVEVFNIGVDAAKWTLYRRLEKITEPGPGYMHFPHTYDETYFDQLTAEVMRSKYVKGFVVREWYLKPGKRNEALDCRVYAFAAMLARNVNLSARQERLKTDAPAATEAPAPVEEPDVEGEESTPTKRPKRARPRRRGGFINSWR